MNSAIRVGRRLVCQWFRQEGRGRHLTSACATVHLGVLRRVRRCVPTHVAAWHCRRGGKCTAGCERTDCQCKRAQDGDEKLHQGRRISENDEDSNYGKGRILRIGPFGNPESMPELECTITCPKCSGQSSEKMRTDACQYFYDCRHCGALVKPLSGDCCVFCSYGDVPCPPVQEAKAAGQIGGCCS